MKKIAQLSIFFVQFTGSLLKFFFSVISGGFIALFCY